MATFVVLKPFKRNSPDVAHQSVSRSGVPKWFRRFPDKNVCNISGVAWQHQSVHSPPMELEQTDVAVEVIITGQQQTAGARESHGGDATNDVVVAVEAELLVGTQVKQPAGGVV
ncbi:hypothetical protein EYF80_017249 [Liparis tanakae]|uniref:Uncharacterized protein n=1 Tax=Liparis tanakae TaxID=230148 RepID=A0A4Z2I5H6_9TELE|nr:hypothetical protein EYF80_017249 [Liparis tanakae]